MIRNEELPIGFTMELAMHSDVLNQFAQLTADEQDAIIEKAQQQHSHEAMRNYVENLFR